MTRLTGHTFFCPNIFSQVLRLPYVFLSETTLRPVLIGLNQPGRLESLISTLPTICLNVPPLHSFYSYSHSR